MGKGRTTIQPPDPVDPGQAMGEYLFGQGFENFQGVTDPILQQRLLDAERTGRQAYTGLELRDIGTFARGLEERANPEYQRIQSRIQALKAGDEATAGAMSEKELRAKAKELYPVAKKGIRDTRSARESREQQQRLQDDYVQKGLKGVSGQNAAEIAKLEAQLANTPQRLEKTEGLFDLLKDSSREAAALQREQLGLQRADDIAALQRFAPQVVQAYRDADPESTRLAEMASARAGQETGLGEVGRGLLSPTEQEALISGRGTEFIQSTGELSPLEQRRVQQSARQASLARGREMGQGALAQEIANRFAEESGKREREIALGAQLLGQEAGLRGARLGQAAGFIGQEEGIQSNRFGQAFDMNRALAGDVGMTILGRPSSSIQLGQQTLGQAQQGAAGQMGPQLFDSNVGYNAALQRSANEFGLLGAQAQADATRSAGGLGLVGSFLGNTGLFT
tara:strand:- start:88 stop:1446 length:1359 start_codon:yes stop_codon:yes gene_type:complete